MPAAITQQIPDAEGPLPTPSICMFVLSLLILLEAACLNTFLSLNIKIKKKGWQYFISSGKMYIGWKKKKQYLKDIYLQVQGKDCPIVCGAHVGKLQSFYIKLKIP